MPGKKSKDGHGASAKPKETAVGSVAAKGSVSSACGACKAKPGSKPWAESASGAIARCLECHQRWQKCFHYLAWSQYIQLINSEASH